MGWQIVKQPDEKWAIWCSIQDNFVLNDLTEQELLSYWIDEEIEHVTRKAQQHLDFVKSGKRNHFSMTWDECQETIKRVHGDCDE
jgi:hypothetical protein